jgi:hypothetical protein
VETFLTPDVLARVVGEFEWPAAYELEDCRPDGIAMRFPACALFFMERGESDMTIEFLPQHTGLTKGVDLYAVLDALRAQTPRELPDTPTLIETVGGASLAKCENGIRNLCLLVRVFFKKSLGGDFSWVATYKAHLEQARA